MVTPSSGLEPGPTISRQLNWDATWKTAPALDGFIINERASPTIFVNASIAGALPDAVLAVAGVVGAIADSSARRASTVGVVNSPTWNDFPAYVWPRGRKKK